MSKDVKKVIEMLNAGRARELGAILQYMAQHYELENDDFGKLAKVLKTTAIVEMKHAEALADRILFLGGMPTSKPAGEVKRGQKIADMIATDIGAGRRRRQTVQRGRRRLRREPGPRLQGPLRETPEGRGCTPGHVPEHQGARRPTGRRVPDDADRRVSLAAPPLAGRPAESLDDDEGAGSRDGRQPLLKLSRPAIPALLLRRRAGATARRLLAPLANAGLDLPAALGTGRTSTDLAHSDLLSLGRRGPAATARTPRYPMRHPAPGERS